jgi:hypothetical protein
MYTHLIREVGIFQTKVLHEFEMPQNSLKISLKGPILNSFENLL